MLHRPNRNRNPYNRRQPEMGPNSIPAVSPSNEPATHSTGNDPIEVPLSIFCPRSALIPDFQIITMVIALNATAFGAPPQLGSRECTELPRKVIHIEEPLSIIPITHLHCFLGTVSLAVSTHLEYISVFMMNRPNESSSDKVMRPAANA